MKPFKPTPNFLLPEVPKPKLIAHRGNVTGPCEYENNPEYIQEALNDGFDIEVDVWFNGSIKDHYWNGWWLGHDKPQYKIDESFLTKSDRFWIHAKNPAAFFALSQMSDAPHYFWHQNDDFTLTSKGFIWTFPNKQICKKSVIVCMTKNETDRDRALQCAGICSDWLK